MIDNAQYSSEHAESKEQGPSVIKMLGLRLRADFDQAERDRRPYEEEWLKCYRQYRGEYEYDIKSSLITGKSKAFIKLSRVKLNTLNARTSDILLNKNWSIDPTPEPDIPQHDLLQIKQALADLGKEATDEDIKAEILEVAKKRAARMSTKVEDALTESRYDELIKLVLSSGHMYGTGVLKGPLVDTRVNRSWKMADGGGYQLDSQLVLKPYVEHVPLWDFYPVDVYAKNVDETDVFQRHIFTKHQVRNLLKNQSFRADAISDYLRKHPRGNVDLKLFENELRTIVDKDNIVGDRKGCYEVLEFWGLISGEELRECGCTIAEKDLDNEVEANIWMVGDTIIKVALNPTEQQRRPYHLYYFERDETSIFGNSSLETYRDLQTLFNAIVRMAIDNAAISAGPLFEILKSLLVDNEDVTDLHPFRIFLRDGIDPESGKENALRIHSLPSHTAELLRFAEVVKQWLDEASALPAYTHGEQTGGVGKTARGLSMLMGAASVTIKDLVRNYDHGVTAPFITAMYHWFMQFSDDESIKGDYAVKATGTSSLVAKEILGQQLDMFAASTMNPFDDPWIKRGKLLNMRAKAHDLGDGVVKTEAEFQAEMQAQQPPPGMPPEQPPTMPMQ